VVNTSTEMAVASPLTVDTICLNNNNNSNFMSFAQLKNEAQSTVRKKMATGTFTYNALRTKTLKERTKTQEIL